MCYQEQLFDNLVDMYFIHFYKLYLKTNKEHLLENSVDVYSLRLTVDISFGYICV